MIEFFAPMIPPTVTAQQKEVRVVRGKPMFFDPPALLDARAKLQAHLGQHVPKTPMKEPVRCIVKWMFPLQ